jgi:hypothetical protein
MFEKQKIASGTSLSFANKQEINSDGTFHNLRFKNIKVLLSCIYFQILITNSMGDLIETFLKNYFYVFWPI